MNETAHLAATIFKRARGRDRIIVALAGPPAAGKSTIAAELAAILGEEAVVVPMDGFHYDDEVLAALGLSQRKGAPETFDFGGLKSLLSRLRAREERVAVPIFDRSRELARAGAALVPASVRIVLVEGNYLLLDEAPWTELRPVFDLGVYLDVPREELERRLVQRWREHGRPEDAARYWIDTNDLPNIDRVRAGTRSADIILRHG